MEAAGKMKKKIIFLTAVFIFLTGFYEDSRVWAVDSPIYLPVIMYHEVKPWKPGKDAVLPEEFENDLKYLADNGYTAVTVAELIDYVYLGEPLPNKPVMLTFDDGYYNNYVHAFPLLKKYGVKMVLSVICRNADEFSQYPGESIDYAHATWEQINEMIDSGFVEIQNHSYDMHRYTSSQHGCLQKKGEGGRDYELRFTGDVAEAQEDIWRMTRCLPMAFAYPYGKYDASTESMLEEMGFLATFTCDFGINKITRDPGCLFSLKRAGRSHGADMGTLLEKLYARAGD